MAKRGKAFTVVLGLFLVAVILLFFWLPPSEPEKNSNGSLFNAGVLSDTISRIVSDYPGEIGVAVIINNTDTVAVNNKSIYPMMSVFKVHQALAICHDFDSKGLSLDTLVTLKRSELDSGTWSPMMKDYLEPEFALTVKELLRYTLVQSDNNASNLMFKRLVGIAETDSFIATLVPRSNFRIVYTESEMASDHAKAYSNYTSPLGAAILDVLPAKTGSPPLCLPKRG